VIGQIHRVKEDRCHLGKLTGQPQRHADDPVRAPGFSSLSLPQVQADFRTTRRVGSWTADGSAPRISRVRSWTIS
jgi:hypothetical protein